MAYISGRLMQLKKIIETTDENNNPVFTEHIIIKNNTGKYCVSYQGLRRNILISNPIGTKFKFIGEYNKECKNFFIAKQYMIISKPHKKHSQTNIIRKEKTCKTDYLSY